MPSIINSDDGVVSGTSGLKSTGGNDGLLNIQSNGSTVVAVTGSGISVTGTVSQTGVSTFAAGTVSAPSITFTGDTNTGIFSPAADTIAFTEGGVESMRIDASGNVGIGTSSVSTTRGPLTVLMPSGQNQAGIVIRGVNSGGAGSQPALTFEKSDASINYSIYADQGTGYLAINGGTTERARIPAAGGFQCVNSISVGNATPTTSGAGITFPATQSASSNANTLDDYEEGTWTPEIRFGGNAVGVTYSNQRGNYTKIGNRVFISMYLALTNKGSSSGAITIIGLPFTSVDSLNQYNNVAVWIDNSSGITGSMQGYNAPNTSTISELSFLNTGSQTVLSNTQLGNSSNFMVNFSYSV